MIAYAHEDATLSIYALRLLGEIAARCEPPERDQAEAHYRQVLTLAEELGMRPLVAHCHLGLGTLYAAIGQRQQARTALSTAIALYRDMEMTFWLPQAEAAGAGGAASWRNALPAQIWHNTHQTRRCTTPGHGKGEP